MSEKVLLDGIEGYNDYFYVSCYYNSFIPILKYFRKDVTSLYCNDVNPYKIVEEKDLKLLGMGSYSNIARLDVLDEYGIGLKMYDTDENIIEIMKDGLRQGHPGIVWVDCFYEPLRNDKYQKEHFLHALLVVGFDEDNQMFHIIEHPKEELLAYGPECISYSDMLNVCEGYVKNFQYDIIDAPVYMEYYLLDENEQKGSNSAFNDFAIIFKNSFSSFSVQYKKGIADLKEYIDYLPQVLENEDLLQKNVNLIIAKLNDIVNLKKVQHYVYTVVYQSDDERISLVESIVEQWCMVRAVYVRYMYSAIYDLDKLKEVLTLMEDIYQKENELYSKLLTNA